MRGKESFQNGYKLSDKKMKSIKKKFELLMNEDYGMISAKKFIFLFENPSLIDFTMEIDENDMYVFKLNFSGKQITQKQLKVFLSKLNKENANAIEARFKVLKRSMEF